MVDESVLGKIIVAADLGVDDVVLEIGPGFGVLTRELAGRVKKVFTVEIDKKLVKVLGKELRDFKNIEVINDDALKLEIRNWKLERYKLVANLPYNITSAVLRKFLAEEPRPELLVLMVQKEVGERVCAGPGEMSLLSLAVQFYGRPEIVDFVSRKSFWPVPEVDSVIIKITPKEAGEISRLTPGAGEKEFFRLARIGFSSRRKQLQNNLANGLGMENKKIKKILEKLGLNPLVRAQDLSVEDWGRLTKILKEEIRNNPPLSLQGGERPACQSSY